MPAFVTKEGKKGEEKWKRAKEAAAKETARGSEGFWKLSNYIFHKMGKTEESQRVAEFWKNELLKGMPTGGGFAFGIGKESAKSEMNKFGNMGQLSLAETKAPMRTGTHTSSVKTPRQKHMPGPDAKPSVFFKTEEFCLPIKHPTLRKLDTFMAKCKMKKCSKQ